jgi:hypothetical protein
MVLVMLGVGFVAGGLVTVIASFIAKYRKEALQNRYVFLNMILYDELDAFQNEMSKEWVHFFLYTDIMKVS